MNDRWKMAKQQISGKSSRTGVRVYADPQGNGKWLVQWRADGKRITRTCDSQAMAKRLAAQKLEEKREQGMDALRVDLVEWRRWLDFKAKLAGAGEPVDLEAVASVWAKHRPRANALMLADAVKRYQELRCAEGADGDTWLHIKKGTNRLTVRFASFGLHEVTADALRTYLTELGTTMAPVSVVNNFKTVRAFLNRAVKEGWIAECAADRVTPPKVEAEEVTVIAASDAVKLFEANRDQPVVVRMALEAFGGLRYSSAARLKAEDVRWAERGILLPGAMHKSGRRHYLEPLPANLWAWLEAWKDDPRPWAMTPRQILDAKSRAFARAKVANPGNVLRHSFCSYHIAKHGDAAKTAILLQHTNQAMLYRHYKGVATAADAEVYFGVTPK